MCAVLSFRLGLTDGVSVVADRWARALREIGFDVYTVAGEGPVDVTVPGLAIEAPEPPADEEVEKALVEADLVVVENLLSIPANLDASRVVARVLRGRPALLHHHDPPWQRPQHAHVTELPPDDPEWVHVTINKLTERQFVRRGLRAFTIYNGFDPDPPAGDRAATRSKLGVAEDELLAVHPVRPVPRKNVPAAISLAEVLGATYWVTGWPEEGYGETFERLCAEARCRVVHEPWPQDADLYAAADIVLFPSTWEGFGNPPVEAAAAGKMSVVGDYPVAGELRRLGFVWLRPDDVERIRRWLAEPDEVIIAHNREVVRRHLSLDVMRDRIAEVLALRGWFVSADRRSTTSIVFGP